MSTSVAYQTTSQKISAKYPKTAYKAANTVYFVKNKYASFSYDDFKESEVIITEYIEPCKKASISFDGKEINYTFDGKIANNVKVVTDFLTGNLKEKLLFIYNALGELEFNIYGLFTSDGFYLTDLNINENFIEYDHLVDFGSRAGFAFPKLIYRGIFSEEIGKEHKSFIIRKAPEFLDRKISIKKASAILSAVMPPLSSTPLT